MGIMGPHQRVVAQGGEFNPHHDQNILLQQKINSKDAFQAEWAEALCIIISCKMLWHTFWTKQVSPYAPDMRIQYFDLYILKVILILLNYDL